MPLRKALGKEEIEMINQATSHYVSTGEDLPYNGVYNKKFSEKLTSCATTTLFSEKA